MWLFEDGHIASRESVSGTVQLQVGKMPELIKEEEDLEPVIVLQKLDWHQDMQLKSIYRQRAKELRNSVFLVNFGQSINLGELMKFGESIKIR